jgi:prepilin-type processing-associated H-X9-DG protein
MLVAILLPALQRVKKQARAVVCQANLKQWGTTIALYTEDNQGRLPLTPIGAIWFMRGSASSEDVPFKPDQYNSVQSEGIACCPMAVKPTDPKYNGHLIDDGPSSEPQWRVRVKWGGTFKAWQIIEPAPPFLCSYGFNAWLLDRIYNTNGQDPFNRCLDILSIRKRGEIPALMDCVLPYGQCDPNDQPATCETNYGSDIKCFCINRHDGYINSLFLDWSVRKVGLKELWKLKWYPDFDTAGPWTMAGGVVPEDWPEWMWNFKDY